MAKLLSIVLTGELGGVDSAWRGWCLRGGVLCDASDRVANGYLYIQTGHLYVAEARTSITGRDIEPVYAPTDGGEQ